MDAHPLGETCLDVTDAIGPILIPACTSVNDPRWPQKDEVEHERIPISIT